LDFIGSKGYGGGEWQQLELQDVPLKLWSNRRHQQTNTQLFTGLTPFLSPNQQRQSIEGKERVIISG